MNAMAQTKEKARVGVATPAAGQIENPLLIETATATRAQLGLIKVARYLAIVAWLDPAVLAALGALIVEEARR